MTLLKIHNISNYDAVYTFIIIQDLSLFSVHQSTQHYTYPARLHISTNIVPCSACHVPLPSLAILYIIQIPCLYYVYCTAPPYHPCTQTMKSLFDTLLFISRYLYITTILEIQQKPTHIYMLSIYITVIALYIDEMYSKNSDAYRYNVTPQERLYQRYNTSYKTCS